MKKRSQKKSQTEWGRLSMSPNRLGEGGILMICFGGWFPALGRFKTLRGAVGLVLGTCLILHCLAPLVLWSIRTIMEATIERKTAAHVVMLWKYKPLNQDDAL
jgi:hypothetical protein